MTVQDTYEALIDELVAAIEQRDTCDPDAVDWTVDARIRGLERELVEQHRVRPGRWLTAESLVDRLTGSRGTRAGAAG